MFFCVFVFFKSEWEQVLHGVSGAAREVIDGEEGADGVGAAEATPLSGAGAAPQAAGVAGTPPERGPVQVPPIPVVWISAVGEGVRTLHGSDPVLSRAQRLPARRGGHGLTLCKETVNFLFTCKISENSSVP